MCSWGIDDSADVMLLGLTALECMTQTQGMTTLGLPIANNKDKASWQQMIKRRNRRGMEKEKEEKRKRNLASSNRQMRQWIEEDQDERLGCLH